MTFERNLVSPFCTEWRENTR